MVPAADSGEDAIWVGGPGEGSRFVVVLVDVSVDGRLQVDDRSEHATLEPPSGQGGEETFDGVEPGGAGGREVKYPPRMPLQPGADLGVLWVA